MHAAYYEKAGKAADVLQLGEVTMPEPGPGEVRVRVAWSGVNPSDVKGRAGARGEPPYPRIIPHSDGSGTIDAVGDGVDPGRIGERVWVWNAAWGRPFGTAAEYVALPAEQAVRLPDAADLEAGACMGIPGMTAFHGVTCHGGVAGQTVLIPGGAGAVGEYAIQMARLFGARRIISTVGSDEKAAVAEAAGADVVLNYRDSGLAERILAHSHGHGVDRIIEVEMAGNAALDTTVVRPEGLVAVYGSDAPEVAIPFGPSIMKNIQHQFYMVYHLSPVDRRRAVSGVTRLLELDALIHRIARRVPLGAIADAHDLVEQRAVTGNVLVGPAETP